MNDFLKRHRPDPWNIGTHKKRFDRILRNMNYNKHTSYATLNIIWTPESVSTISLTSPTCNRKATSSNGFCICPLPKFPRSPPFFALFLTPASNAYLLQSLSCSAKALNVSWILPDVTIWLRRERRSAIASSLVQVMLGFLQDAGRRDPLHVINSTVIFTYVSLRYARLGLGKAMLHTKQMPTSTCGGFHVVSPVNLEMMKAARTNVLKK